MIGIIDYGLGNLGSVANALDKLGIKNIISSDPIVLKKSDALILPGVGAASEGMRNLKKIGLERFIIEEIKKGKPFMGICLGMQLLFDRSEEGDVSCLGIIKGQVKKFKKERKVPQIGWNRVKIQNLKFKMQNDNLKFKNLFTYIPDKSYFYFVNSYYCVPDDKSLIVGITTYGEKFASIIAKDNIVATQFHPEKSGKVGFQLLKNYFDLLNRHSRPRIKYGASSDRESIH